jgi:hypothetical protein
VKARKLEIADQCVEIFGDASRLRIRLVVGKAFAPAAPVERDDALSGL